MKQPKLKLGLCALLLFVTFVALGTWQVQRLYWKRALIERVEQRVHAPPVALSEPAQWTKVSAESDEYRRVHLQGIFLDELNTQVLASTVRGRGHWVMTPLRMANGYIVYINRGFILFGTRPCKSSDVQHVTGLLRMSELGGTLLQSNQPALQRWYSRDIGALAASKNLDNVAPFFIDAEANSIDYPAPTNCQNPVAGLTVIGFHNNHLVYIVTWYTLALMVIGAVVIAIR